MLKQPFNTTRASFPLCSFHRHWQSRSRLLLPSQWKPLVRKQKQKQKRVGLRTVCERASVNSIKSESPNVKAIVTVQETVGGVLSSVVTGGLDGITDLVGKSLLLELVSQELDAKTNSEKTIKGYAHKKEKKENKVQYEAQFEIPGDFGEVGAVMVENEHRTEMFLKDIVIDGFPADHGPLRFTCNSWIHSKHDSSLKRVFFTDKKHSLIHEEATY